MGANLYDAKRHRPSDKTKQGAQRPSEREEISRSGQAAPFRRGCTEFKGPLPGGFTLC